MIEKKWGYLHRGSKIGKLMYETKVHYDRNGIKQRELSKIGEVGEFFMYLFESGEISSFEYDREIIWKRKWIKWDEDEGVKSYGDDSSPKNLLNHFTTYRMFNEGVCDFINLYSFSTKVRFVIKNGKYTYSNGYWGSDSHMNFEFTLSKPIKRSYEEFKRNSTVKITNTKNKIRV
jgi:hypothetical protein